MASHTASLQGGMTSSCGLSTVKQKMQFIVHFVGTFLGQILNSDLYEIDFKTGNTLMSPEIQNELLECAASLFLCRIKYYVHSAPSTYFIHGCTVEFKIRVSE